MSKLFYIIGASGAGKDTLINYARSTINGAENVIFVHRYITRPANNGNENHVFLSKEEFMQRAKANFFALDWESHGNFYGISIEIDAWLQKDFNVIVNGSREYLPIAQQRYPEMKVILVVANKETIIQRLLNRGRESNIEIEKRVFRTSEITSDLKDCMILENNSSIEEAGRILVRLICKEHTADENNSSLIVSGISES